MFEKLGGEKLLYEYTEKVFEELIHNNHLKSKYEFISRILGYFEGSILSHIKAGFLQLLHHITGDN